MLVVRSCRAAGYWVSDTGRIFSSVRSRSTGRRKELRQRRRGPRGRWFVYLAIDGKPTAVLVHHMVLDAFKRPRRGRELGRHLDDDPDNNRADNLEWGTVLDNAADRKRNGGYPGGGAHHGAKLTDAQAADARRRRDAGERVVDLRRRFGISIAQMEALLRGDTYREAL